MVVPEAVSVGAVGAVVSATIEKLVLEISKKMWLAPLTIIRFVVPILAGTVILWVPSLAVADKRVIG